MDQWNRTERPKKKPICQGQFDSIEHQDYLFNEEEQSLEKLVQNNWLRQNIKVP